ncbi:MAG: hypothetical protein EXR72_11225 [Myxococcales bacterium]|nr:hypothetical protein [Myxococcales bacterium]
MVLIRRGLAALLLTVAAGCSRTPAPPPCAGSCLDVKLNAAGIGDVRQVVVVGTIDSEKGYRGTARFPDDPGPSIGFPAYLTVRLGGHTGDLALSVSGLDANRKVIAGATGTFTIIAGGRGSLELTLTPGGGAGDGGAPPDLVTGPVDLATADLATIADAGPPDLYGVDMTTLVKWRYASFSDRAFVLKTDLHVDGPKVIDGAAPGVLSPYMTILPGVHNFDVHKYMDAAKVEAAIVPDVQPPKLLTVFAALQGCAGSFVAGTHSVPPQTSDPMKADVYLVHVACGPGSVNFVVDAEAPLAVPFAASKSVSLTEGMHTVSAFDGATKLGTQEVKVAKGEVWSLFFYQDTFNNQQANYFSLARDVP